MIHPSPHRSVAALSGSRWASPLASLAKIALSAGLVCLLIPALAAGPAPAQQISPEEAARRAKEMAEKVAREAEAQKADGGEEEADQPQPGEVGWHPQPPDGVWRVDEQGRQYYVDSISKEKLKIRRLNENQVRISWGITLDVVDENEDFIFYKVYRTDHLDKQEPYDVGYTEEEKEAVKEKYRFETETTDRLRLEPASDGLPERGQWRNGFDLADMNGDGHLDIVHGPTRRGQGLPFIFLGDGEGNWRTWDSFVVPAVPYDYGDAAAADFNGDGHMDMALASHQRGIVVLVGNGEGEFTPWSEGIGFSVDPQKPVFSSRALEALDWDGDGRADLLALGEGPSLAVRRHQQEVFDGSYGPLLYLSPPAQGRGVEERGEAGSAAATWRRHSQDDDRTAGFGDALATGDFDGDGRTDFAVGSSRQGYREIVYLGREDGGWQPELVGALPMAVYVRAVEAADFDGDGRDELAVGFITFEGGLHHTVLQLLDRTAEGWKALPVEARQTNVGVTALAAGRLDGDEHADLVALTGNGYTRVYLGRGDNTFLVEETPEVPMAGERCRGYHTELADFDHDGLDELVTAFAGEPSATFDPDRCINYGSLHAWDPVPSPQAAGGS